MARRQETAAGDVHHAGVVAIVREQVIAVVEKTVRGNAVILQNNCFFGLAENPIEAGRDAMTAPHVRVGEIRKHLAVPIHLVNERAGSGAFRFVIGVPRAIGNEEQAAGTGTANGFENARRQLRPVKYK